MRSPSRGPTTLDGRSARPPKHPRAAVCAFIACLLLRAPSSLPTAAWTLCSSTGCTHTRACVTISRRGRRRQPKRGRSSSTTLGTPHGFPASKRRSTKRLDAAKRAFGRDQSRFDNHLRFINPQQLDNAVLGGDPTCAKKAHETPERHSARSQGVAPKSKAAMVALCNGGNSHSWQCYAQNYPDLMAAFGSKNTNTLRRHFENNGYNEGRGCACPKSG